MSMAMAVASAKSRQQDLTSEGECLTSGTSMLRHGLTLVNAVTSRVRHDLVDQATDVLGLAAAVQLRCWRRFATSMLSNTDLETK
jgi:hypothetical protein